MICNNCRTENVESAKFCVGCGASLEVPAETVQTAPAVEAAQESGVQVETVKATDFSAAPPVMTAQEGTVQPNSYYQPYQQPQQPMQPQQSAQNTAYWQQSMMPPKIANEQPVSLGKWMGIMTLEYFLGLVHLVLLFVWGFSSGTEESLKNYARARLIWVAIGAAIMVLLLALLFNLGLGLVDLMDEVMYY